MKKLYVRHDDGTYEEVSALLAGHGLKPIYKTTVADAVSEYLNTVSESKRCHKTEKIFFNQFVLFCRALKLENIDNVSQKHLLKFQKQLSETKTGSSVNRQFTTYAHFFKKCLEFEFIAENPMTNIKKVKEVEPVRSLWTTKEIDAVLKRSPLWFKWAFLFMALTGCRQIEVCNLRKQDCNFNDDSIAVFTEKNSKGFREIPISQPTKKILQKLCSSIDGPDYVFKSSVGTRLSSDRLGKTLAKIQKRCNLKRIPMKSLRHTYATNLCEKDINLEKVRLILGHSQIRTTLKYVKLSFSSLKKVVNGG